MHADVPSRAEIALPKADPVYQWIQCCQGQHHRCGPGRRRLWRLPPSACAPALPLGYPTVGPTIGVSALPDRAVEHLGQWRLLDEAHGLNSVPASRDGFTTNVPEFGRSVSARHLHEAARETPWAPCPATAAAATSGERCRVNPPGPESPPRNRGCCPHRLRENSHAPAWCRVHALPPRW